MLYIDYGNRATVPKTKLGSLPASFQTPGGYAKLYNIALIRLPSDEEMTGQGIQALKEDLLDKTVKINVEYKYVNIWSSSYEHVHTFSFLQDWK